MDERYWKEVVAQLAQPEKANWAAHVLASELGIQQDLSNTNVGRAINATSAQEVIEGTIRAYQDWSAQPYCDQILSTFDPNQIVQVCNTINSPISENMRQGVTWLLENVAPELVPELHMRQ